MPEHAGHLQLALSFVCVQQDDSKAARLLAEHRDLKTAIIRLMRPLYKARDAAQKSVSVTWANKETLSLLHTYCISLQTLWAAHQVPTVPNHT